MDSILVDLLNIGRICMDAADDQTKFTCAYFFVEQYGLLGFMVEAPISPDFMLNDEVTLFFKTSNRYGFWVYAL